LNFREAFILFALMWRLEDFTELDGKFLFFLFFFTLAVEEFKDDFQSVLRTIKHMSKFF